MGHVAVTGSVAFDTIMVFRGRFADHVVVEKAHVLNVSFLIDSLSRRRGGTAANIAYTMALLGERPLLCAAVGADFDDYDAALIAAGVDTAPALRCADVTTAAAYITTDLDDNQIAAFHPGAMARAGAVDLGALSDVSHVVISPDAPDAMAAHVEQAAVLGAKLVFAPAQQLPALDDGALCAGLDAAWLVVGNDYELEMVRRRTGRAPADLAAAGAIVAQTLGGAGSRILTADGTEEVPVAPADSVVDPTGAGDAYLAGLLTGLRAGLSTAVAGRLGALAAAHVVEVQGPQGHAYTLEDFSARFRASFGAGLALPATVA